MRVSFLGGLGEIGRNAATIEIAGRVLLVDCGLLFPNEEMPGVDLVLPDFQSVCERSGDLEGCVLTHGHEDHTGALSYLLEMLDRPDPLPVWGSAFTLGIARNRIEEAGLLSRVTFVPVGDGERWQAGPFDIETIPVTHSVPHGHALAFHTPQGLILHTGDFKIDQSPVDGRRTDLARIGQLAKDPGIRLLLSDSTNADEPGFTDTETSVGPVLKRLFVQARGQRVIVACFASHVHRIQQVVDAALEEGRVVATLGRSMAKNVSLARSLGLLRIPDGSIVDIETIESRDPGQVCVLSTGSQGEPMSALVRMAAGESKWLEVGAGDVVVLSSHAIPGNEWAVSTLIDDLYRRGAEVVYTEREAVHVSGHARRGELAQMLALASPEWCVPIHGEYRHLVNHAHLAASMGIAKDHVLICEDGDVLALTGSGIDLVGSVPAGHTFVDGVVGDIGHGVLRDRRLLAEEGVVVVMVGIDTQEGTVVVGPEIVTRGWVGAEDAADLLDEARDRASAAVEEALVAGVRDPEAFRRPVRQAVGRLVAERTRRRPMIVPVILEA